MRNLILIVILFSCCNTINKIQRKDSEIIGVWIPQKINWVKPNSGVEEIDAGVRTAQFKTLYFNQDNLYIYNSTQSKSVKSDSLMFEFEPGIELWKGNWELIDSSQLEIKYKLKYSPFKGGEISYDWKLDTLPVTFRNDTDELEFEGTIYVKTSLYNEYSIRKINNYQR